VFNGLVHWLRPYAEYLYRIALYNGLHPRVTSVYRSPQAQARLYQRYQQGLSRLPAAPPGRSKHQFGLAFDMVVDNPEALGAVWTSWGGRWGGSRDPVHYEV
jgi:hypothetical protein